MGLTVLNGLAASVVEYPKLPDLRIRTLRLQDVHSQVAAGEEIDGLSYEEYFWEKSTNGSRYEDSDLATVIPVGKANVTVQNKCNQRSTRQHWLCLSISTAGFRCIGGSRCLPGIMNIISS